MKNYRISLRNFKIYYLDEIDDVFDGNIKADV